MSKVDHCYGFASLGIGPSVERGASDAAARLDHCPHVMHSVRPHLAATDSLGAIAMRR